MWYATYNACAGRVEWWFWDVLIGRWFGPWPSAQYIGGQDKAVGRIAELEKRVAELEAELRSRLPAQVDYIKTESAYGTDRPDFTFVVPVAMADGADLGRYAAAAFWTMTGTLGRKARGEPPLLRHAHWCGRVNTNRHGWCMCLEPGCPYGHRPYDEGTWSWVPSGKRKDD